MATATHEIIQSPTELFHLTLTKEEAGTLRFICDFVGGDPTNSPRRDMDAIRRALISAGAPFLYLDMNEGLTSGIYFADRVEGK